MCTQELCYSQGYSVLYVYLKALGCQSLFNGYIFIASLNSLETTYPSFYSSVMKGGTVHLVAATWIRDLGRKK